MQTVSNYWWGLCSCYQGLKLLVRIMFLLSTGTGVPSFLFFLYLCKMGKMPSEWMLIFVNVNIHIVYACTWMLGWEHGVVIKMVSMLLKLGGMFQRPSLFCITKLSRLEYQNILHRKINRIQSSIKKPETRWQFCCSVLAFWGGGGVYSFTVSSSIIYKAKYV